MTVQQADPLELPDNMEPDNPLWRYALAQWQDPQVAEACLALQAEGWSVSRILSAGWLATHGQSFSGVEGAKVTEWRSRVTGCLRFARKSVPRANDHSRALREALAKAELMAEQLELALVWQTLKDSEPERGNMHKPDTIIGQNLLAAAPSHDIPLRVKPHLELLARRLAGQTTKGGPSCS